jgi:hypothetical protein
MTLGTPPQTPVRERSRDGLRELDWSARPTGEEAWPDRLRIEVRGRISWNDGASFWDYMAVVGGGHFFPDVATPGRRYRSKIARRSGVKGEVAFTMISPGDPSSTRAGQANVTFGLTLNPTRTRALAVRRNAEPLEELGSFRFFNAPPSVAEAFNEGPYANPAEQPLDGKDNVMLSAAELGGSTVASRAIARNEFFRVYETQLQAFLLETLTPPTLGMTPDARGLRAGGSRYEVELDWGRTVVQQAEIYVERRHPRPLALMKRLHDRGLELARRLKAGKFVHDTVYMGVEQDDGFPVLVMPLIGKRNIELAIYAKTNRRVRFEVRYRRSFGAHLKNCSVGPDRLTSLLTRLTEDAAKRMPWKALEGIDKLPPEVDVGDLTDLISQLVLVTRKAPSLFEPIVNGLLLTGGVVANEQLYPGITTIIAALERREVLRGFSVQLKEERANRRYGLTDKYARVRSKALTGFAPSELFYGDEDEHVQPLDHYEEAAEMAGSRAMVYRPLD